MTKDPFDVLIPNVQIIEPPDAAFAFFDGESRKLTYKIRNIGVHIVKDINLESQTKVKTHAGNTKDDFVFRDTIINYSKIIEAPTVIPPNSTRDAVVQVSIPVDYDETIIYKGKQAIQPCRVFLTVKAIEHKNEL